MENQEILRRMEEIKHRTAEIPDEEDKLAIERAKDETSVTLEAFQESLKDYSGRIVLRIPRSLHRQLKEAAAMEGVSLNQYMLYKLSHS